MAQLLAHLSGDLSEVFGFMNAEMRQASYNVHGPTFTFMDGCRTVSVYPRRAEIEPSYERHERPPALEIVKRLPRTNCRACSEATCLAFAVRVWRDET